MTTHASPTRYHRHRHTRAEAEDVVLSGVFGTEQAGRLLGVAGTTVYRFARRWHPPVGPGHSLRLSGIDVLVCQAYLSLRGRDRLRLRELAETAIGYRPARWLVLSTHGAATYPEIEAAGRSLERVRYPVHHRVIDLCPAAAARPEEVAA
jgi:hypothetical protein